MGEEQKGASGHPSRLSNFLPILWVQPTAMHKEIWLQASFCFTTVLVAWWHWSAEELAEEPLLDFTQALAYANRIPTSITMISCIDTIMMAVASSFTSLHTPIIRLHQLLILNP